MVPLANCPECGSAVGKAAWQRYGGYAVECKCGEQGPNCDSEYEAHERWNTMVADVTPILLTVAPPDGEANREQ